MLLIQHMDLRGYKKKEADSHALRIENADSHVQHTFTSSEPRFVIVLRRTSQPPCQTMHGSSKPSSSHLH